MERYQDVTLTPQERAEDLLGRLTVQEKVGQLNQRLYGFNIYERDGEEFHLTQEFKDEVKRFQGLGVLYGLYRADPWANKDETTGITKRLSKKAYNLVQSYVMEHSRFGIPMMLSTECPHGHQALEGGLLPVNLCAGATFHPELLEQGYAASGKELKECHVDLALMSVLDVLRDPRWGRSEECYSEDPYLSAKMAASAVRGMQKSRVSVVAKHFCAQGETTGGVNASAARIGERELREIHMDSMRACCEEKVEGVMAAYNEIDGVYCHANRWLLKDVLRDEMGFQGVVMADGVAIDCLNTMTGDPVKSGATALNAGVDISLWDTGFSRLDEALELGYITMETLDAAVLRVLELKFRRGLFEHPYMEEEPEVKKTKEAILKASYEIAKESVILLKNEENLLPLENKKNIAVIGPGAEEIYYQLGDYTPPVHKDDCVTILEGIKNAFGEKSNVSYARGCDFFDGTKEQEQAAIGLAQRSDVVIVVVGGSSSRFHGAKYDINGAAVMSEKKTEMDCGEGMDCADLRIPEVQEKLLAKLHELKIPVVTVVLAGRPYVLTEIEKESEAILYSFYPGPRGGQAVGEILSGQTAPAGRLPVSLPRHVGQVPVCYNYKASYQAMKYYNLEASPLYTFGEGKTYTTFEYSDIELSLDNNVALCTLKFVVKNTGNIAAYAVPQLYLHHITSQIVPRTKELKAFTKVLLEPGETKKLELTLTKDDLSVWGTSMKREMNDGKTQLFLFDMGEKIYEVTIETKLNKIVKIVNEC